MVEPSQGMGAEFDAIHREAGIRNARRVQAEWMDAEDIVGDVVFAGCVTYFVGDIVPFVEKLVASARRRVMITLWSEPAGCNAGPLFRLAHGEPQEPQPGFRELMSVLWEQNILPDLLVLPGVPRMLRKLDNYDLLVIDDLGYLRVHERRSLGITSNLWENDNLPRSTGSYITRSSSSSTCQPRRCLGASSERWMVPTRGQGTSLRHC